MKNTNGLSQRPMLGRLPGMDTSTHLRTAFRPASEQVWQTFLAALRELPPDARAVLLLHDVLGAGFEDIVPLLGLDLSACRQRLALARKGFASGRVASIGFRRQLRWSNQIP